MAVPARDIDDILQDSEWLAHRYDDASDDVQFRRLSWAQRADFPFLSEKNVGALGDVCAIPTREINLSAVPQGPIHFIFHSAFCGSTLLTQTLADVGMSPLSEPQLLNDMIGAVRRGMPGRDVAERLDKALALLGRPQPGKAAVLVKPSNLVNSLARGMLALRPKSRAIFLYAPLEIFLISVARKGLECRLWVRELMEYQIELGMADFGYSARDYFRMSDLQIAALGWLVQFRLFHMIQQEADASRLMAIDSETLTQSAAKILPQICRHLDPNMEEARVAAAVESPALRRHSKSGSSYSAEDRLKERESALAAHADEIAKVVYWAQELARQMGISLT